MKKLKWYAGGSERRAVAIEGITTLLASLPYESKVEPLRKILIHYRKELRQEESAVILVLNRFMLDLSRVLITEKIAISDSQQKIIKSLQDLLQVRYG
ncbi:bacteriocin immunity protein [Atopobacter phocae]|uniref:bacteriocin immunity protein n=1 Tax=Atopobacter phocae TaxID=136492 RepID=UPI00047172B3|nr:bacteriocin immunity protein [Atopobacter phocae]